MSIAKDYRRVSQSKNISDTCTILKEKCITSRNRDREMYYVL